MTPAWNGLFVALWTPTDRDGQPLPDALRGNLQFVLRSGLHGILALGSTGEFLFLDVEQRKRFLEMVIKGAGSTPVISNISDIRPQNVADLGRFAKEAGAAAVAVLPPYFFSVAQEDLIEFFVRAGQAADLPLILYNFPERTGNRISLETVAAVADRTSMVAIKQSGSEFGYHRELAQLAREKQFVVITGSDTRLPEAMELGASGCVSGLANAVPDLVIQAFRQAGAGAVDATELAFQRMRTIGELVGRLEFPLNVAAAMEARGLVIGEPKSILSPATKDKYRKLVSEFQHLFQQWNLS